MEGTAPAPHPLLVPSLLLHGKLAHATPAALATSSVPRLGARPHSQPQNGDVYGVC